MKTADSIEQQEERKAARGDRKPGNRPAHNSDSVSSSRAARIARLAPFRWQPGQSANPGGRPRHDVAAEIARAVFTNNAEALYKAYLKAALKGNAYAFKELADRAFGKLKERHEVEIGPYREMTEEALQQRVRELEQKLGYAPQILPPVSDEPKVN
jgi:hypothetical protein